MDPDDVVRALGVTPSTPSDRQHPSLLTPHCPSILPHLIGTQGGHAETNAMGTRLISVLCVQASVKMRHDRQWCAHQFDTQVPVDTLYPTHLSVARADNETRLSLVQEEEVLLHSDACMKHIDIRLQAHTCTHHVFTHNLVHT